MPDYFASELRRYTLVGLGLFLAAVLVGLGRGVALGQGREAPGGRLDLTGNGLINAADGDMVADSWAHVRQKGECLTLPVAARDIDGNGCVEVGDVQAVLAHWGELADGAMARPGARLFTPASAATFTVDSAGDESDHDPGDGFCRTAEGRCTLRAALEEANRRPGRETILFDIRSPDGSCPELVTITPARELMIDDASQEGLTLDGYSQCGAAPNSLAVGGNAQLKIELKGAATPGVRGLVLLSPHNLIRGLAVYNFDGQVQLSGGAAYNRLEGNFLGTNAANSFATPPNLGGQGLRIRYGANFNVVGCGAYSDQDEYQPCATAAEVAAARNVIAGNGGDGILLEGEVAFNRIVGNYIGLGQDGVRALGNGADGVDLNLGPRYNWVGGLASGEGNVVSANGSDGLELSHGSSTQFNQVAGNRFGLNAAGTAPLPNRANGVSLEDGVDSNSIYNNVVSGNGTNGIRLYVLITNSQIHDNLIGVGPDGTTPLGNGVNPPANQSGHGIFGMGGSQYNLIRNNVIANNRDQGIRLSNSSDADHNGYGETYFNTISQNSIYNNGSFGVLLSSTTNPDTGEVTRANQGLPAPWITGATTEVVEGAACPNCTVEVFIADKTTTKDPGGENDGEGKTFIGASSADSTGSFAVAVSGVAEGELVTATATDSLGNTSQFGRNVRVTAASSEPTPSATASPSPTATETAMPTATPTSTATATGTHTPVPTETHTPAPTETPASTGTATPAPTATEAPTPTATPAVTVVRVRVTKWSDDVEERVSDGQMSRASSDLELVDDSGYFGLQTVGIRFAQVAIPPGATITRAYLEFTTDEPDSGAATLIFYGEASDNAAGYSYRNYDLSSRSRTAASVTWENVPPWLVVAETHPTPDLSPIVQAIVSRSGWTSGNSLAFIVTGSGERTAVAYDSDPQAAPLLHVEYVPPVWGATVRPVEPRATATRVPLRPIKQP